MYDNTDIDNFTGDWLGTYKSYKIKKFNSNDFEVHISYLNLVDTSRKWNLYFYLFTNYGLDGIAIVEMEPVSYEFADRWEYDLSFSVGRVNYKKIMTAFVTNAKHIYDKLCCNSNIKCLGCGCIFNCLMDKSSYSALEFDKQIVYFYETEDSRISNKDRLLFLLKNKGEFKYMLRSEFDDKCINKSSSMLTSELPPTNYVNIDYIDELVEIKVNKILRDKGIKVGEED